MFGLRSLAFSTEYIKGYIVFQNNFKGFQQMHAMSADTLQDAIQNITEGCAGCRTPSQHFVYYIYRLHESKVPLYWTHFDVYKYIKAIPGSFVTKPHTDSHEYALTHQTSMAWLFTDDLFGDN